MNRDEFDRSVESGAYSLNALSPEERAAFQAALAESEALRAEVAGFTDTAAVLGLAVPPVQPRQELRAELLARIGSTPQLPENKRDEEILTSEDGPSASVTPITAARHTGRGSRGPRARSRLMLSLSAAAAAVVLFGGGALAGGILTAVSDERVADQFAALNAAPDVARQVTALPDGGTAALVSSESLHMSAIVLDGADQLPDDKAFQLWYVDAQGAVSAGVVRPGDGTVYAMLEGEYTPGDQVAMTIEPKDGSPKPTSTPMLLNA